jgi:hypothetical protein
MAFRAVDPKYLGTYPAGQIEIAIYSKDADTLSCWVAKHSGPPTSNDMSRYWTPPTNQLAVAVAGRPGLSFDWVSDMGGPTIHATSLFLGTAYVFVLQWWSSDASYATTVQQYARQMLATFKDMT